MLSLPAACASAPPEAVPEPVAETPADLIQQGVDEALAAGFGGLPRNAAISVIEVQEPNGRWVVQADFEMPERFGRPAERFAIVSPCEPADPRACARKLVETAAGAR